MQGIAGDECGGKLLSWIEYQKLLVLLSGTVISNTWDIQQQWETIISNQQGYHYECWGSSVRVGAMIRTNEV